MHFTDVKIEWSPKTFAFYLIVILACYFFSRFLTMKIKWKTGKKRPLGLAIVTAVLLFVKCFNTTGRDLRGGYIMNFLSATSMSAYRDQTVEPGFRLLMVVIRNLTENYAVFLFVVGLLTVLPVIYIIHKYEEKIDVPAAILLYTSIYFISSFSAYRQYMAASLSLFVLDAIIEKKPYKALIWIVISSSIHTACVVLIIPYVLCFLKLFSKQMIAISALAFIALFYFLRGNIATILAGHERYYIYFTSQEVHIGFEQIVYYFPLFLLLFICRKFGIDKNISRITYIYLITGFAVGMSSYILPILGRMFPVFLPIVILIPYYLRIYKDRHRNNRRVIINTITLVYSLARFVIWIVQYYSREDLMPYTNVFRHII